MHSIRLGDCCWKRLSPRKWSPLRTGPLRWTNRLQRKCPNWTAVARCRSSLRAVGFPRSMLRSCDQMNLRWCCSFRRVTSQLTSASVHPNNGVTLTWRRCTAQVVKWATAISHWSFGHEQCPTLTVHLIVHLIGEFIWRNAPWSAGC